MKLKTLFCGIAAAAMFTACSSDEPIQGPGEGGNNGGNVTADGSGYITVGINLPTTPVGGGRANDNFDDGTANEYAVNSNNMLLLFTKDAAAPEADAVFHSAYSLATLGTAYPGTNQTPAGNITTSYRKTVKVQGIADNTNLYGLVMLNYDNVATGTIGDGGKFSTLSIAGNTVASTTKFSDIVAYTSKDNLYTPGVGENATNFFMTNAPVSVNQGGFVQPTADGVQTLVYFGLSQNVLYPTEAEAEAAPAASFFVERAVAKVTLSNSAVSGPHSLNVEKTEWILDNTKDGSYVVRNMGSDLTYMTYKAAGVTTNAYRFAGHNPIGQTAIQPFTQLFRTYWCTVPVDANFGKLSFASNKDAVTVWGATGAANPQYCHENTFPVADMDYEHTTRALLKVTFKTKEGEDGIYVVNGLFYVEKAKAQSHLIKALLPLVAQAIKEQLPADKAYNIVITTDNITDYVDVNWTETTDGKLILAMPTFKTITIDGTDYPINNTISAVQLANINAENGITYYKNGVSYYAVMIKHFGDDLTPWTPSGSNQLTTETAYGTGETANQNYLGRYGMVRNNWYDLEVTSINKLGEPVIGNLELNNKPDDNNEVEKWLSFNVNLLAWAKRVQNIEL